MGLIGNGTGKSTFREKIAISFVLIILIPVLLYRTATNKPTGFGGSINWLWFLGPLVIPFRWAGRGWQATRRALGWDQLR